MVHYLHLCDIMASVVFIGCIGNILSPCVLALLAQTNDVVPRGPQHWPSGRLLVSWLSLVLVRSTADHSTASWRAMTESTVDNLVDMIREVPHQLLSATQLRQVRPPLLWRTATVL